MADTLLTAMKKKPTIGDTVLVAFPTGDQTNNPARKFDGQEFVVKSIHRVAESKNSTVTRVYYELFGAKSDMGVHYAFLEDELILL